VLAILSGGLYLEEFKKAIQVDDNELKLEVDVPWEDIRQAAAQANLCLAPSSLILDYHKKANPNFKYANLESPAVVTCELPHYSSRYFIHTARTSEGSLEQHLAVKGSTCIKNWRTNAAAAKVWDSELGVYLHRGFKTIADEVVDGLLSQNLLREEASLRLSGHSQGGAVAAIVAAKLLRRGYKITQVIAFGAPGFTDSKGSKTLSASGLPLLRVDNHFDVVPYAALGYKQFGDQLVLLRGQTCRNCLQTTGVACNECSSSPTAAQVQKHFAFLPADQVAAREFWWANSLLMNFSLRNLGSHRMQEYEKEVEQRLQEGSMCVPLKYRYQRNLWTLK